MKKRTWVQALMSPEKRRELRKYANRKGLKMQPAADMAVDCLLEQEKLRVKSPA